MTEPRRRRSPGPARWHGRAGRTDGSTSPPWAGADELDGRPGSFHAVIADVAPADGVCFEAGAAHGQQRAGSMP